MKVMPSAANLFSAVALAVLALVVSQMIPPLLPEGTDMGYFYYVNAVIGLAVGWYTVGKRMGRGWSSGVNAGLTGAVVLVFWGLFVQASNEMVRLAMRNRFDGAFEALVSIFQLGTEYGIIMATVPILTTLVVGGIVVGLIGEMAAQRWN